MTGELLPDPSGDLVGRDLGHVRLGLRVVDDVLGVLSRSRRCSPCSQRTRVLAVNQQVLEPGDSVVATGGED